VVECNLAKVEVEGSNPFSRSSILYNTYIDSLTRRAFALRVFLIEDYIFSK
jgi:hypothetical protein